MEAVFARLWTMNDNCQLPPEVLENCPKRPKVSRPPYHTEEENFVIEEMSKPFYTGKGVCTLPTAEAIRAEHDKKRLANIPGFETVRTTNSLRKHITVMKNNGKIPDEVRKKLEKKETGASSSSSAAPNQQTIFQETNEDLDENEIAAEMIEELLNNTDYELDFSKLQSTDDE